MLLFFSTVLIAILEAMKPNTIVEIGADQGHTTLKLVDFVTKHGGTVHCVDPRPNFNTEAM